ncbi:hypothetical protein CYLTODRAFT_494948 [Cylindrobasidium torrendii FP15055 ss-10]|uniref:Zn(2)-C6 fungal-type domain-containing protein n=1 Tax=Cylindrobasidium torrendii FP15055 ss-10 TaxID=1314674 RepID=A0A0D7AUB7_9AGAR|nr:hypothetical protein CYLTODRAFT_494948 [Cylindrobasidium torrendii FP15055 ss-10]
MSPGVPSSSNSSATRVAQVAKLNDWREVAQENVVRRDKLACIPCRKRRQGCNRGRPECLQCQNTGRKCVFEADPTGIAELVDRVRELEKKLKLAQRSGSNQRAQLPPRIVTEESEMSATIVRLCFIKHRARLGVSCSSQRSKAIMLGDATVLHPAILHAGQLMGCVLRLIEKQQYTPHPSEARQLQRVMECLETADGLTALEVQQILFKYNYCRGRGLVAREHFLKAVHAAIKYDMHLKPLADGPPLITLRREEEVGILSQLMYMDVASNMLSDTPRVFPDYFYDELRELPTHYGLLAIDSYLVAARASAVFNLHEARVLVKAVPKGSICQWELHQWRTKYAGLVTRATHEIEELGKRVVRVANEADQETGRALLSSVIHGYAALIILHSKVARFDAAAQQYLREAVHRIAAITQTLKEEDFEKMCPTTVFAWAYCVVAMQVEQRKPDSSVLKEEVVVDMLAQSAKALDSLFPLFDRPYHYNTMHSTYSQHLIGW